MNEDLQSLIRQHRHGDYRQLLHQFGKYPLEERSYIMGQIVGWQTAAAKIPTWAQTEGIIYPSHLPLEQCSSEATACYKATIIAQISRAEGIVPQTLVDLTGGLGVDCYFMGRDFAHVVYVEQQKDLCELARHNLPLLGLEQVTIHNTDSLSYFVNMPSADWIYVDPARRDGSGRKVSAITQCEPNIAALEYPFVQKSRHTMIKLSPMLDITCALQQLHFVRQVHVVSVDNECKELLLLLENGDLTPEADVPIHCVNLTDRGTQTFTFTRAEEQAVTASTAGEPQAYLYEPNASSLKAGAFNTLARRYGISQLHPNSHLYTSEALVSHFPGRTFRIDAYAGFGKKELKDLLADCTHANLATRNFPTSVAQLRQRLKLADGGDTYLFATTLADGKKALLKCHKA